MIDLKQIADRNLLAETRGELEDWLNHQGISIESYIAERAHAASIAMDISERSLPAQARVLFAICWEHGFRCGWEAAHQKKET